MLNSMSFLPYQGRYLRIYNEARTLADAGYEVTLIAWDRQGECPPDEQIDGFRIQRISLRAEMAKGPLNAHKHLLFNMRLIRELRRRPVDIVHCFNLDTIPAGLPVAKLRGKRVVLDLCEPDYYMYWHPRYLKLADMIGFMEKGISRSFDAVFVHNLYQMRKFRSYGIPNLVQISSVPGRSMILRDPSERNKRKRDIFVLGRIGTIFPNSGMEETAEAFQLLVKRGNPVRLLLAGKVLEEYREKFEELIRPIQEHVDLLGAFDVSKMPDLYRQIDLSIHIHKRTPWFRNITPTKFFESLANGVPVIASHIGDYKEIIQQHPCGIVVEENDPEVICEAVESLVKNPEAIDRMAESGLELIQKEYNWDVMKQRLLDMYQRL